MAAFTWGDAGAQMTPEAIAAQRKIAQAMMQRGGDYSPVQSGWQGAARVAEGLMGGLDARMADVAEQKNAAAEKELLASLISPGAPTNVVPPGAASGASAATVGAPPASITSASLPPVASPAADSGLSDAITKVAAARGVDPAYLTRLAKVESGGNLNSTTPLSSAGGPFQFINSTAKQYGLNNRFDANESADAAARLTLDNKAALTQALGREPTPGELYLAHQQGSGGAAKILAADPNAPIEKVIGFKAAANNGAVPGMTAGQFAQKWTGRFSDIGSQPTQTAAQPDPAALPVNAQPAQGYAIPGQSAPGVQAVAQAASPSVNPKLLTAMASPYVSDGTKKILGIMLTNQLSQDAVTQVDLGNKVGIMDKRGNIIRTIDKGEPNKGPTFGETGEVDPQTGQPVKGWIDPRDKSVTPYRPQPAASAQPSTIPPVPAGVDPKVWRETFSKATAAGAAPASFEDTAKLRHEVTQLPSYKNMAQAAPIYQAMHEAAGRDTKAADLNLVYGLGKIMDPGSVVREGEIQMANNAQGWQEKLNGYLAQINSKGGLTPEGRQALMAEAHGRIQAYKGEFDRDAGRYKGITERNRMNTADVIPDFGTFEPWMAPKANGPVEIDGYKIKAK